MTSTTLPPLSTPPASSFERWAFTHLGLRLVVALIAAIATGIAAHAQWPGSVMAVIAALPFGLLLRDQTTQGWNRGVILPALFTLIAWIGIALEPGPLNLSLFWAGCAVMELARHGATGSSLACHLEDVIRNFLAAPFRLVSDVKSARAVSKETPRDASWLVNLVLPVAATLVFGALLAVANPMIEQILLELKLGNSLVYLLSASTPIALVTFMLTWAALRAAPLARRVTGESEALRSAWHTRYFSASAILMTLLAMNLLFAIENVLDLSYVWRGITLPDGMTFKEYVHRGSYTLIVTALLAGALVIVMFQPGAATEKSKPVRVLVYLWVFQNVLLVASSANRTIAYSGDLMTLWRVSALVWMGLVAVGLALIGLRILLNKSNAWLLNANIASAALVLLYSGIFDYKAYVANWNVDHAIAVAKRDGTSAYANTYMPYMWSLGPNALPALQRLVAHEVPGSAQALSARSHANLDHLEAEVRASQADWRTWTWRYQPILSSLEQQP